MPMVLFGNSLREWKQILMYFFSNGCERKRILEKFVCQSSGLYLTTIRIIESTNILDFDLGF